MQRIQSLYLHWSLEAKKKSTLTNNLYQKHKFEMINGFKQFSTCQCAKGNLVQRIPFLHQELALGKKFSKCYNYGGTAFFAQATPGGWGGYAIFFHARNFFPPPPWSHPTVSLGQAERQSRHAYMHRCMFHHSPEHI